MENIKVKKAPKRLKARPGQGSQLLGCKAGPYWQAASPNFAAWPPCPSFAPGHLASVGGLKYDPDPHTHP